MTNVVALDDARRQAEQRSPVPEPQACTLRVLTINTHKGLAPWNRRFMLGELRDAVRTTGADVVFLQEVSGEEQRPSRGAGTVSGPHYEFLADQLWPQFAYGRNAVYPHGHHGNALLSRFPIVSEHNHDISVQGPEPRGLLHCVLDVPQLGELHAICVHLGLREAQRLRQLQLLNELVETRIAADAALVVAGDFNDWRGRADAVLQAGRGLHSVFERAGVAQPRTFPARWPLLSLDRIYVSNLRVQSACVLSALPWPHLSDHLPLLAELCP
jgi:endonuclease/exonuclease/phosphatase family metal-dependent hydrolase